MKPQDKGLELARRAAYYFGAENWANQIPFNQDARKNICYYYGVTDWKDIPKEQRHELVAAYQEGEKQEKALCRRNGGAQ